MRRSIGRIVTGSLARSPPPPATAFGERWYPPRHITGAPDRDPTLLTGRVAPASPRRSQPAPACRCPCPARLNETHAPGRSTVAYTDRTLTCVDCGVEFIHSSADQEFYAQK